MDSPRDPNPLFIQRKSKEKSNEAGLHGHPARPRFYCWAPQLIRKLIHRRSAVTLQVTVGQGAVLTSREIPNVLAFNVGGRWSLPESREHRDLLTVRFLTSKPRIASFQNGACGCGCTCSESAHFPCVILPRDLVKFPDFNLNDLI